MDASEHTCAWCAQQFEFRADGRDSATITDGICSLCALKLTDGERRSVSEILDLISEPVFLLDGEGRVLNANSAALEAVGRQPLEAWDRLGGDVIECAYAVETGGCGKTVHCRTCAVRNAVMETLASGEGFCRVPAFQSIRTSYGAELKRFLISTECLDDHILLRIDDVKPLN